STDLPVSPATGCVFASCRGSTRPLGTRATAALLAVGTLPAVTFFKPDQAARVGRSLEQVLAGAVQGIKGRGLLLEVLLAPTAPYNAPAGPALSGPTGPAWRETLVDVVHDDPLTAAVITAVQAAEAAAHGHPPDEARPVLSDPRLAEEAAQARL